MDTAEVRKQLMQRAQLAAFRIQQTTENQEKRDHLVAQMEELKDVIIKLDKAMKTYTSILATTKAYIDERREDSNVAVASAMRAASYIVPACDGTLVPKCEGGEAWFETEDGIDVSRLEGSGFRSILSVMMRSVVLRSQPRCLQTLVLDEIFSKLSVENSATLSTYLPILAQDTQIISIEQKPEIFSNNSHTAYKFYLDGDHTVVQKEDVTYDETY